MDVFGCQGPPTRFERILLAVMGVAVFLCWASLPIILLLVPYK